MVDTMRTISEITTLLADNTAGDISPQDIRDMMATLRAGHAEIYVSSSSATSFSDTTTYVQPAGTWTLSAENMNWNMSAGNGLLTYTGAADRIVHVAASVSFTSSANSQVTSWGVAKNSTVLTPSINDRKTGTGGDVGALALHALVSVSNGDTIGIKCRNESWTGAQTITATHANIFCMDMAGA